MATLIIVSQDKFQSTLLQEERHCSLSSKIYSSIISIHAPTRGATQPCYWIILHLLFQSTLLQEERQSVCTQELNATIFQSTLLQEERPVTDGGKYCQNIFQSTLLQEERLSSIKMEKSHIISIHAPTRGATDKAVEGILNILNFNPRSYKRSDINRHTRCLWRINFNPRSYKRSDVTGCADYHANTKFQSTLLQEERHGAIFLSSNSPRFQSTLLQEERHDFLYTIYFLYSFNPRSYKRSDIIVYFFGVKLILSIHAPTRGATST